MQNDPSLLQAECSPQNLSYLIRSGQIDISFELYDQRKKMQGKHDFERLEQMALSLLEQGISSPDPEVQLLSLYGASIAGLTSCIDILAQGIKSDNPTTQIASIQFLAKMQDDRCDDLLNTAMSSPLFGARMEAGFHLAQRKHPKASGQIESLMYKIPHPFWVYFPQFFALIGTKDSMIVLKKLIDDSLSSVRVEAILSAANYGRDDLVSKIRAHATHSGMDEQEACAAALGLLKDSESIPQLQRLLNSKEPNVHLAAAKALYSLGDLSQVNNIKAAALHGNLFAIGELSRFPESKEILISLLRDDNLNVRFNAALSLLKLKEPLSLSVLEEFLIRDCRDFGFQPNFSHGHSLLYWKVIPSISQKIDPNSPFDLLAISEQMKQQIVIQAIELPERSFLTLAKHIFETKQVDLVPLVVSLLENHQTPLALQFLKSKAEEAGSPHIRAYCTLALYRLRQPGTHEKALRDWISHFKKTEMIRFKPLARFDMRSYTGTSYELSPEESSRLLIEIYETLSHRHDPDSLDILLEGIKNGHPKNRYTLAGLLIQALQ